MCRKANSKIHDGLCKHCKGVLEWRVRYNKYKSLTQPKKCIKCAQRTVKDAYHILCKPCSLELDICCKCGKKEKIVIPINSEGDNNDEEEEGQGEVKGEEKDEKRKEKRKMKKLLNRKRKYEYERRRSWMTQTVMMMKRERTCIVAQRRRRTSLMISQMCPDSESDLMTKGEFKVKYEI
ncbi:uncharacterized protein C9orf85 homolog isoform X1 [Trematomus bernacchii]|uniref:uncharacterized protein C9orf85 homolog isoform X1 n=1 Tax=Trematomus bernacchii TaxID=40690 RepID=UPI00146A9F7B|nr:uncharacterized protein C9orf85 homolog isoform X1 [Trematomus bernacchii]